MIDPTGKARGRSRHSFFLLFLSLPLYTPYIYACLRVFLSKLKLGLSIMFYRKDEMDKEPLPPEGGDFVALLRGEGGEVKTT
jgi:hypothetical protein